MRRIAWLFGGVCTLVAMSANAAVAQNTPIEGYATAHLGGTRGGDVPDTWRTVGGSVAVVEDSGWGAEMDLGYASHKTTTRDNSLGTFMVNLNWVSPKGLVRPFGVVGAGVVRLGGCLSSCVSTTTVTDFGLNAGAGVYVPLNDMVAVRGDGRYFWAPGEHPDSFRPDNYGFWRFSVGVTLQWVVS